jgi:hypothetical protein
MLSVEEIVQKLRANYEEGVKLLPVEIQEEFRTRVFPLSELEEYAPFIRNSVEFEGNAAAGLTLRKIGRKVSVKAFSNKIIACGLSPDNFYGRLLAGVFEFR